MNTQSDKELIAKCLLQIEDKLGWGNAANWHSDVFFELSETIQQQTQVLLSPTTLKRVWGKVNYNSSPSISTLNALSQFIDYENWRDFKNKHAYNPTKKKPLVNNMSLVFSLAALIALAFISLFSITNANKSSVSVSDFSKIKFSSKTITTGMPNSVLFDFDVSSITSDSIYIQQYWDVTKTIKINSDQKQATGIYYFPGYFRAKLVVDGHAIKEHDLFIKSNGWSASIDYTPVPKYLKNKEFITNNGLVLNKNLIDAIRHSKEPLVSSYHFIEDLGHISGDNFTLETSLKNIYNEKWAVCQTTSIYIIGSKGAIIMPLTIPGCVSDINVMLNDNYLNGKKHDLSALGHDISTYRNIKITVENQHVTMYVDQQKVFSDTYKQSLGKLVGIRYRFLGAGHVKHLTLKDTSENVIIQDNFYFSKLIEE